VTSATIQAAYLHSFVAAARMFSPRQRAALTLVHVAGLSIGKAARRLRLAFATVLYHLRKAEEKLQRWIDATA
jgi:DNA-directed RNA polymerase specialized sigma24 family protein